jgi:hypothetical protein
LSLFKQSEFWNNTKETDMINLFKFLPNSLFTIILKFEALYAAKVEHLSLFKQAELWNNTKKTDQDEFL